MEKTIHLHGVIALNNLNYTKEISIKQNEKEYTLTDIIFKALDLPEMWNKCFTGEISISVSLQENEITTSDFDGRAITPLIMEDIENEVSDM